MYTVHEAKTNLSKLLRKAARGEEVIIARGKKPVAKLVALSAQKRKRVPGRLKGKIWYTPDAFDPLTQKELSDVSLISKDTAFDSFAVQRIW